MKLPKVTIILATFNRAHFISETLFSIQNQTYINWECIIVDDYSADNTKTVIEGFIKKDKRFTYYLKTANYKKGLSGTRNQGLDIAADRNSEYIQLFDDDDIMHPQKLELQIAPFLNNVKLDFTVCKYKHFEPMLDRNFDLIDYDCTIISVNLFEDYYNRKLSVNSLGPLWKGSLILKYRFDEDLLYSEERDLYLKIFLLENPTYKNIDFVLFYYRKHIESNTNNRYSLNIKKLAFIKSDMNLFYFVSENNLWNYFLLKQLIKKFVIYGNDDDISNKLLSIVSKDEMKIGGKILILKFVLYSFIIFRKNAVRFINKI